MKISEGSIVELNYTLSVEGGEVVESSEQEGPLSYMHGNEEIPPLLEAALSGAEVGKKLELTLSPDDAFGEYDVDALTTVPRSDLPEGEEFVVDTWIAVGVEMEDEDEGVDEYEMEMRVVEVNNEAIVLDANHPLAGVDLTFDVKIVEVREATEEELAHGHSHGQGGHAH